MQFDTFLFLNKHFQSQYRDGFDIFICHIHIKVQSRDGLYYFVIEHDPSCILQLYHSALYRPNLANELEK